MLSYARRGQNSHQWEVKAGRVGSAASFYQLEPMSQTKDRTKPVKTEIAAAEANGFGENDILSELRWFFQTFYPNETAPVFAT